MQPDFTVALQTWLPYILICHQASREYYHDSTVKHKSGNNLVNEVKQNTAGPRLMSEFRPYGVRQFNFQYVGQGRHKLTIPCNLFKIYKHTTANHSAVTWRTKAIMFTNHWEAYSVSFWYQSKSFSGIIWFNFF